MIVRSAEVKKNLPAALKTVLVLTVEEAKGLEFDMVVLYNLFSDAQCDPNSWRAVFQPDIFPEFADEELRKKLRTIDFVPEKHESLCAELKVLLSLFSDHTYSYMLSLDPIRLSTQPSPEQDKYCIL